MYHFNNATPSVQFVATPNLYALHLHHSLSRSCRTDNWSLSTGVTSINLDVGASIAEYWSCLVHKNFQDSSSHRIFGRMHGALNIGKNKK